MSRSTVVGVLSVVGGMIFLIALIAFVDGDRDTALEPIAAEPLPGQRFQVTATQEAERMTLRVLTDHDTGHEYLIVDWGEGTGVTPLLPPADSLSTDSADQVKVSVVPKADPDE